MSPAHGCGPIRTFEYANLADATAATAATDPDQGGIARGQRLAGMLEGIKDTGPGMTFHRLGQARHGDLVALR